ncbi:MAG: hypothetical protein ACRCYQ_12250 [Nocardioides sp.]
MSPGMSEAAPPPPESSPPALEVSGAADDLGAEAEAAQEQVRIGIYISAVRCLITYALIPGISATGSLAGLLGLGGVLLQIVGAAVSTYGAIKLWQLRHRARHLYALVTLCVYLATAFSLIEYAVSR